MAFSLVSESKRENLVCVVSCHHRLFGLCTFYLQIEVALMLKVTCRLLLCWKERNVRMVVWSFTPLLVLMALTEPLHALR